MVVVAAAAAAVVVVVVVVRGGKLAFGAHTYLSTTPNTKGRRLGQRACIGRVAQGQRGGGMLVLGVYLAGNCVGCV